MVLFFITVSLLGSDEVAIQSDATKVRIPLAIRKFIAANKAAEFCFGEFQDSEQALAAYAPGGQLCVVVSSASGGGKIFRTDLQLENAPRLLMADLDKDQTSEILVCSNHLSVYQLSRDGLTLKWKSKETFGDKPPPRLAVTDLDGNGRLDVIVLNYKHRDNEPDTKSLYIYMNQVGEKFRWRLSGTSTFTDEHGYHSSSGMAVGDFLGDKRPEIVVGNSNGWLWLVEVNNGKPSVTKNWKVVSGGAIGPGLAVGNLDGDSENELLVGTNGGDIFAYRLSRKNSPQVIAKAHAGRLAYGVKAADIDGDGRDEFLLARGFFGYAKMKQKDVVTEVWKLKNDQLDCVWRRPALGFKYPRILLNDLDNDGSLDMLIYGPSEADKVELIKPKIITSKQR